MIQAFLKDWLGILGFLLLVLCIVWLNDEKKFGTKVATIGTLFFLSVFTISMILYSFLGVIGFVIVSVALVALHYLNIRRISRRRDKP